MNGVPDPMGLPPRRPTVGGILRDSLGAVQRFLLMAAEEATDAALQRVRLAVIYILLAVGMAIAAIAAYLVLLHQVVAVLSELGCHPLWRVVAILVLFVLPLAWLILSARTLSARPPRRGPTP